MIFEQLSLEFYLAGKTLPWTKPRATPNVILYEGELDMIRADPSKAKSQYFNLRG